MDDLPEGCLLTCERSKPLGTAHAIWCARKAIDGSFAVINADDFYGWEAFTAMSKLLEETKADPVKDSYCMVAYRLEKTLSQNGHVARGVCRFNDQRELEKVTEYTRIVDTREGPVDISKPDCPVKLNPSDPVSMNLWGFTPSIFGHLERAIREFIQENGNDPRAEIYIPFVVDELIRKNLATVVAVNSESDWFGVTYPEDRSFVQNQIAALIEKGVYPNPLISNN